MINEKLGYSDETQQLIERQCKNVERKSFVLQKKKAKECLLKTYDLFGLLRPKKVVWVKDIFDKQFAWSTWSAGSAGSARSAWSARSAGSARSARSAGSAWSAGSAGSWTALDYDFDWYVFEYEYCQNPSDSNPVKEDRQYLEYCELLMQAKEYGCGYWVEWEGVLYLAPTPLVLLDAQNKYHSTNKPAIRWQGGKEFYFLSGVSFTKTLWKRIVKPNATLKTVFSLENMEQRMAALKVVGTEKLLEGKNAKRIDKSKRGNELYLVINVFNQDAYFLKYTCPSTGRVYVSGIDPEVGAEKDADLAMSWKFQMTKEEYQALQIEA